MMLKVFQAETDEHKDHVRALFWEYLQWANSMVNREFGVNFNIQTMIEEDMQTLGKFLPPHGRLLLAEYDDQIAGIACLKMIGVNGSEIKRMYVRPASRGKGIGHALVEGLLAEARKLGCLRVRLDSARFMHAAHKLYRSVGFQEIAPYEDSEIPQEFQAHWIFMEKVLG